MKVNTNRARGAALLALGKLEERLGRLLGNPAWQCRGFQHQLLGRARMTFAAAQASLQSCIKASMESAEQAVEGGVVSERERRQAIREDK